MAAEVEAFGGRRDHLSTEGRSRAMAKVHRRDTSAEIRLRRSLWLAGVRGWRCDVASLPGRPDIAFSRWRVAVFVDGLLWHGHPTKYPARLTEAWRAKIARNVERDREANRRLQDIGWRVIRLWDRDIRKDPEASVERIRLALTGAGADDRQLVARR